MTGKLEECVSETMGVFGDRDNLKEAEKFVIESAFSAMVAT